MLLDPVSSSAPTTGAKSMCLRATEGRSWTEMEKEMEKETEKETETRPRV